MLDPLILGLAALVAIVVAVLIVAWRSTAAARAEASRLGTEVTNLRIRVSRLAPFEKVADATARAAEILRDAESAASRARAEADRLQAEVAVSAEAIRARAEAEASTIRSEAIERTRSANAKGDAIIADAERRAAAIVQEAHAKAEALAGDALRAVQEADKLERTVRAMRNKLEGYGDRYLIPTTTLIDELAAEMGHTEAAQRLKVIRDEVRQAIKEGKAADCDYVEDGRRETAIRFVADAFNGKVDSILACVKHDNAGALAEEMRDDFILVNHNGEAFRNARIRESYLALRLEELKWAAIVHGLKVEEREEQRRIKEQLREEEKARKEYERAMREAARDEELVKKAMEKAQAQLARASEDQRAKYEAQLTELAARLKEAEEKNKRALSMAQQTKQGHVYIISNIGSFGEHVYKIGLTRRLEPLDRIRELGDSSVPYEFDVHALIFAEDAPALEHQLHRHFIMNQVNKVNYRKEFFRVDLTHIRQEIEGLGLTTKWTMAAAAQEYRESLKIEELIAKDPAARAAWIKRQYTYEAMSAMSEGEDDSPAPPGLRLSTEPAVVVSTSHPDPGAGQVASPLAADSLVPQRAPS
ncbi:MAG: DUF4041 domain-containing protein [Gemmatimonadetes bacterium]|nr:DUF4041 domain-containing protein [Gemmatimonadota bacterium]MBK7785334.1 DUF4041 domain-containing protein [Gemmatimonadota bacterium]